MKTPRANPVALGHINSGRKFVTIKNPAREEIISRALKSLTPLATLLPDTDKHFSKQFCTTDSGLGVYMKARHRLKDI